MPINNSSRKSGSCVFTRMKPIYDNNCITWRKDDTVELTVVSQSDAVSADIIGADAFDDVDNYVQHGKHTKQDKKLTEIPPFLSYMDIRNVGFLLFNSYPENQHIEIDFRKHHGLHLDYSIQAQLIDREYPSLITSINTPIDKIEDIPVDFELFINRDSYVIRSKVEEFVDMVGIRTVFIYDITDLLSNKQQVLRNIVDDKEQLNVLYHGFVEKFFPMVPIQSVSQLITNGSIYGAFGFLKPSRRMVMDRFDNEVQLHRQSVRSLSKFMPKTRTYNRIIFKQLTSESPLLVAQMKEVFNSLQIDGLIVGMELRLKSKTFKKLSVIDMDDSLVSFVPDNTLPALVVVMKHYDGLPVIITFGESTYFDVSISSSPMETFIDFIMTECKRVVQQIESLLSTHSSSQNSFIALPSKKSLEVHLVSFEYIIPHGVTQALFMQMTSAINTYTSLGLWNVIEFDYVRNTILLSTRRQSRGIDIYNNEFYNRLNKKDAAEWMFDSSSFVNFILRSVDFVIRVPLMPATSSYMLRKGLLLVVAKVLSQAESKDTVSLDDLVEGKYSRIRLLKNNDPELFDMGSNTLYSRKCQGEQQPILLSKSKLGNKPYLKYWNFTKGKPEYYGCDSTKFQHVKFLTGVHPKNYCLPCCKKRGVDASQTRSQYVKKHEMCMQQVRNMSTSGVSDVAIVKRLPSRYVTTHNAKLSIDNGRLMHPHHYISRLIQCEQKCKPLAMLGLPQTYHGIRCPILYIVATVLNVDVDSVVNNACDWIINNASSFFGLGAHQFKSANDMVSWISKLRADNDISIVDTKLTDWNTVFTLILRQMGTNIIEFFEEDNDVRLDIPSYTMTTSAIQDNSIIVIARIINGVKLLYPLFRIDANDYFTNKFIEQTTFNIKEMQTIADMCLSHSKKESLQALDANVVVDYARRHSWTLARTHVNKRGLLYAITFTTVDTLGISRSAYICVNHTIEIPETEDVKNDVSPDIVTTVGFINAYNSNSHTLQNIVISKVVKFDGMVDACVVMVNGSTAEYICLFTPVDTNTAIKVTKCSKVWELPVSISHILDQIDRDDTDEPRLANHKWDIYASLYETNLYSMLTMCLSDILSSIRDVKSRKTLVALVSNAMSIKEGIDAVRNEFPSVYETMSKQWGSAGTLRGWKKLSMGIIDNNRLAIDEDYAMQSLSTEETADKEIRKGLLTKVTIAETDESTRKGPEPTPFASCADITHAYHCKNKKLIVSQTDFDTFVPILVNDVLNPFKRKFLIGLSTNVLTNHISDADFVHRMGERIVSYSTK